MTHLAGKAINISKTTSSHALSYAITSGYGIPHGVAVALTISPMLAYNARVTADDCADPRGHDHVMKRIALILDLLEAEDVAAACGKIEDLIAAVGCPRSLREAGIATAAKIQEVVSQVDEQRLSNNPRRSNPADLLALLTDDPPAAAHDAQ